MTGIIIRVVIQAGCSRNHTYREDGSVGKTAGDEGVHGPTTSHAGLMRKL